MKTPYVDPLIPLHETRDETLTRLSANIGTLTGLMDNAERMDHDTLAAMFNRSRDAKVAQAEEIIAQVAARHDEPSDDRRFLLVHGHRPAGVVRTPSPRPARLAGQLALTL